MPTPSSEMPVDATVVRKVRPEVGPRETEFLAYAFAGSKWECYDSATEEGRINIDPSFPVEVIRIPGTVEAAYLKERAELLEELLHQIKYSKHFDTIKAVAEQIDALDAAHKGGDEKT